MNPSSTSNAVPTATPEERPAQKVDMTATSSQPVTQSLAWPDSAYGAAQLEGTAMATNAGRADFAEGDQQTVATPRSLPTIGAELQQIHRNFASITYSTAKNNLDNTSCLTELWELVHAEQDSASTSPEKTALVDLVNKLGDVDSERGGIFESIGAVVQHFGKVVKEDEGISAPLSHNVERLGGMLRDFVTRHS
ncbi:hypothetical protein HDV00_009541 [Rhizophlyctis rosea]|nr:hypothetical protein HDV00_009541 [Rhizophlyctis rosea]